ncbi:MAG: ABC transporter permease [Bauldia sp.]
MTAVAEEGWRPQERTGLLARLEIVPSVVHIMWKREMLRYRRDRSQLFGGLSRTVLWLLILGYGLGAALREVEGYSYAVYVLPGVVVLNVLFASLQCAISLVYDRHVGLLREVMVSPAPILSVTLGKLFGGATIAVFQGTIPLAFAAVASLYGIVRGWFPSDPVGFAGDADRIFSLSRVFPNLFSIDTVTTLILAWAVMFLLGILMTAIGVVIASRMKTFEGFGAISNGIIQPLYFLSGSIFPLRGVIGGVGFTQIPDRIRVELNQLGVNALGASWFVQLPFWIQFLVYANPVSYALDLLRFILLQYNQLDLTLDYAVTIILPFVAIIAAAWAMNRMLKSGPGRMPRRRAARA